MEEEANGVAERGTSGDEVSPMGDREARVERTLTGRSVGDKGNLISFDGDSLNDVNAYGQYEISLIQFRAGYRQMSIDYEDDSDRLDVGMGGPLVSAGVSF